jgi:hypothetical protein
MAFDTNILNSWRTNVIALAEAVGALLITPGGLPAAAARHRPADRRAVGTRALRGHRAAPRLGGRQVDRAPNHFSQASDGADSMTRMGNQTETAAWKTRGHRPRVTTYRR